MLPERYFICLFLLLAACSNTGTKPKEAKKDTAQSMGNAGKTITSINVATHKFSSLDEVVADTTGVYWGNYADNPTSILHFTKKGYVQVEYYGQCWYTYPITITNINEAGRHIVMQWDDDMDCLFDIGFDKIRSNIPKPDKRSRFAILNLRNDTLFASYLYPEWVKEMNKKDTGLILFPESFAAKVLD